MLKLSIFLKVTLEKKGRGEDSSLWKVESEATAQVLWSFIDTGYLILFHFSKKKCKVIECILQLCGTCLGKLLL